MKQLDLFDDYKGSIHSKPTDTEEKAWDAVKPYLSKLRVTVLESLAANDNGATGSETAEATGIWLYTVKPRLTELSNLGLVEDSGRRSKNNRGHDEIVWQVTPFGKEALKW